jgi:phage gp29-like protein
MGKQKAITVQQPEPITANSKRVVNYSRLHDDNRDYVTDSPTAARFATILQNIDDGDLCEMMQLNEEMESKDAHLFGVASTRRRALTALDWEIVADETAEDKVLANEAAAFVEQQLRKIDTFEGTLEHLSTAIGPNLAAVELIWENSALVETVDIPGHRLNQEPGSGPEILVVTDDNLYPGEPMPAGKFIIYTPETQAGLPFRRTMMRAVAWLYLLKHFARADWAAFSEIYGIPFRVGRYDALLDDDSRTNVANMLRDMSADGWALLPNEVELEFHSVAASGSPHNDLIDWLERKQSILYLGQTLTTENTNTTGSLSLGKVHDNVRTDLLLSDMKSEARILRSSLFKWMTMLGFPNKDAPVPHFKRKVIESKNIEEARLRMDQLAMARERGLMVDDDFLYETLDIPKPKPRVTTAEADADDQTEDVQDES